TLALPKVSAYVTSLVRNMRDRDDVLQETAVAVIESFDRYDPDRSFDGWALGVARNQVGLYYRRLRRDVQVFDTEVTEQLAVAFEEITSDEMHQLDYVRECMKLLDGRARQICDLRYRNDQKPAAIAPILGMTANSVAKALQRIREQLRECITRKSAATLTS